MLVHVSRVCVQLVCVRVEYRCSVQHEGAVSIQCASWHAISILSLDVIKMQRLCGRY